MELASVLSSVTIMGVIIAIGALLGSRITVTDNARKVLITIIVNIAMPCIILDGIFRSPIDQALMTQIFMIFFVSVLFSCIGIAIGWLVARLLRIPSKKAREVAILSGLGNTGFIGIPLCAALFGPKGALLAAVFDAGLDFTLWTVAVMLLQDRRSFSLAGLKALINIPIIAIIGGLIIAAIGFTPPKLVSGVTGSLANLASPLAMMYIGILIPSLWKNKKSVPVLFLGVPITVKLLIFPIFIAVLLLFVNLPTEITQVVMVQVAMPTLTIASILFARYAADEEMGAINTVFCTLIALFTIPLVVMLGNYILQL